MDEFGQLANEYVEARKGPKMDGKFVGKKQRNFKPKSQDENISVFADVRPEASSSGMNDVRKQENSSKPKKPLESVKCFNCSEFGHFANSCPKPDRRKLGTKGSTQGYLCLKPVDGEHKTSPFVLEGKLTTMKLVCWLILVVRVHLFTACLYSLILKLVNSCPFF